MFKFTFRELNVKLQMLFLFVLHVIIIQLIQSVLWKAFVSSIKHIPLLNTLVFCHSVSPYIALHCCIHYLQTLIKDNWQCIQWIRIGRGNYRRRTVIITNSSKNDCFQGLLTLFFHFLKGLFPFTSCEWCLHCHFTHHCKTTVKNHTQNWVNMHAAMFFIASLYML